MQVQEPEVNEERDALICEHLPLVRQVAQRFYVGSNSPIEMNDLVQYGVMGLIDATEKYDAKRGTSFHSYARFRIKGSILDGLRHIDFVPRSVRRKRRELLAATQRVEQETGRAADDREVAEALDLNPEELRQLRESVQGISMSSVEEMTDRGCEVELTDAIGRGGDDVGPEHDAEQLELNGILGMAIDELPEKERLVLSLYYFDNCTMREVGDVLGVTESRVSQLHAKAVKRLQCRLREPLGMAN